VRAAASASSAARPSSAGDGPAGACRRFNQVVPQLGEQPLRRLVPHTESLRRTAQREQRVAATAREVRLSLRPALEHGVELGGERRLCAPLDRGDPRPALLCLDLQPRALAGGGLCSRRRIARCGLHLDRRRRVVRARRLELGTDRCGERRRRLAAQHDSLAAAPQPVKRSGRLLARARGIGELLLGALALGDQRVDLLVQHPPFFGSGRAARFRLDPALAETRKVKRRDRCLQPSDLDAELLGALGSSRLQREGAQALLHLVLEIARALDLDPDPRELQLGAMTAALEAAETGRLLGSARAVRTVSS